MKRLVLKTLVTISAAGLVVASSIAQTGFAAEQVIPAKRSISGTVRYANTRESVADVHVFVATRSGCVSAETGVLGRYRLEGRGSGECLMDLVDDATNRTLARLGEEETIWAPAANHPWREATRRQMGRKPRKQAGARQRRSQDLPSAAP